MTTPAYAQCPTHQQPEPCEHADHRQPTGQGMQAARIYHALPKEDGNNARTDFLNVFGSALPADFWACVNELDREMRAARLADASEPEADLVFRKFADIAADVANREPRQFLFEPVIVAGDYGVMSAERKAGKSWGGVDAAVSCAAGLPWLGEFPCRAAGPVVFFYGEGSDAKLTRRIHAVAASKGLAREEADALDIVICCRAPKLTDAQHLHLITKALAEYRPRLIVLDPLYLSVGGAKGADLYAMGELLGGIQRIVQDAGATFLVSHHWNKSGSGNGHDRSSGVGPQEWGRFLIAVAVVDRYTDQQTKESTATLKWQFAGDEIPDQEVTLIRRVRADDPKDLNSPMHYSVVRDGVQDGYRPRVPEVTDRQRAVLVAMAPFGDVGGSPTQLAVESDLVRECAGDKGKARSAAQKAINGLLKKELAEKVPGTSRYRVAGTGAVWHVINESAQHIQEPLD
ncbi:AAA family ATPase [Streptomyces endophyticus]|uniref:Helicase RepA family protein n=1 Tax=Streptomyces endophyticus TaxID=714166 RepID=A0ABU6FCQ2_9ACTN|nr:AAA family ATPase [Streptomyces endophyticus]MEB8341796.1 helicase RepA family protein [Streptomyces endophyticus]